MKGLVVNAYKRCTHSLDSWLVRNMYKRCTHSKIVSSLETHLKIVGSLETCTKGVHIHTMLDLKG